ncbi:S-layer family protein [Lentilactobacillus kefiri]|uniref:S-layer family protein n=1 Tax=Lentilactobacillus kefiri TaxID=33962 RepID=UPI001FB34EAB|nr:S-layer family protein [Lentilactobacillus kefiri]UOD78650.1 S-layer family protein [Lentilactobacillus kefiri]
MQLDLKKSLFVSVAVLGFVAAVGGLGAQSASAKSRVKVTSNKALRTLPQSRNVTFTGDNALFTKAGTLRGAKKVASTATLSGLANSSLSTNNVRAYRVATTSRGSVYFKVVTFDKQYRGWIYGGKSIGEFAGGLDQFKTFDINTIDTLSQDQLNANYKLANPGTANDGKTVTYKQPLYTQYKIGRAITDSTPYADKIFKIDKVGNRTRENDRWVHIYDINNANSPAAGWILMSGLKMTVQNPIADNAIQINLVDPDNHSIVVKTFAYTRDGAQRGTFFGTFANNTWTISSEDQTNITAQIKNALAGTQYELNNLSPAQLADIGATKFGYSVNVVVNKINYNGGCSNNNSNGNGGGNKVLPTTDKFSTILPYAGQIGQSNETRHLLTPVKDGYPDTKIVYTLPKDAVYVDHPAKGQASPTNNTIKVSPSDIDTNPNIVHDWLEGLKNNFPDTDPYIQRTEAAKSIDAKLETQAKTQYRLKNQNFKGFVGTPGNKFTEKQLMSYIQGTALKSLVSPNYPGLSSDSTQPEYIGSLADWNKVEYQINTTDSGTIGTPVKAYYDIVYPDN